MPQHRVHLHVPPVSARIVGSADRGGWRPEGIMLQFGRRRPAAYPVFLPSGEAPADARDLALTAALAAGMAPGWLGDGFGEAAAGRLRKAAASLRGGSLGEKAQHDLAGELEALAGALAGREQEWRAAPEAT